MEDIKKTDLKKAQKNARVKAIDWNQKAGLKTYIIRGDNVIEVDANGEEKIIKKAMYKTIPFSKRKFVLKNARQKN